MSHAATLHAKRAQSEAPASQCAMVWLTARPVASEVL